MAHVILGHCCKDASCVQVCPQNCIHPAPGEDGFASTETLFIDPTSCIDCTACVEACPASAIKPDYALTATELPYAQRNREFFADAPAAPRVRPRPVFALPLTSPGAKLSVAVVGSGPAAMYTVRELLHRSTSIQVTVYEQHETFGGLLRRGVSLDHAGVRNMIRLFDLPFGDDRVTVVPHTEIGVDVSIDDLRATFDAVVIACGASQPRRLDSADRGDHIHQAIDILVAANSGAPTLHPPILTGPECVVVGAGNVALDAVRWVAKNRGRSAAAQIEQLVVLSRSAPERASFTPSAFYELLDLDHTEVLIDRAGAAPPAESDGALLQALSRLRTVDLREPRSLPTGPAAPLRIVLSFGQEATDVAPAEGGVTVTTAAGRIFHAGSAICAAGFTTKAIDGVPLDGRGTVPNEQGQVISVETGEPLEGLYVVGWAKRGASGGVGDNRACAAETVTRLATNLLTKV